MYATDRRRQTASLLNAPPKGAGHNKPLIDFDFINGVFHV